VSCKNELTMVIGFVASSFTSWKQESFFRMRLILAMKGILYERKLMNVLVVNNCKWIWWRSWGSE